MYPLFQWIAENNDNAFAERFAPAFGMLLIKKNERNKINLNEFRKSHTLPSTLN
jgi:hypothetical protein